MLLATPVIRTVSRPMPRIRQNWPVVSRQLRPNDAKTPIGSSISAGVARKTTLIHSQTNSGIDAGDQHEARAAR